MNDNDILLANQNGCELVLTTDGDFPAGSKVLYCGDKTYDLTNVVDGTDMFRYNTDLNVDFNVDLPHLTNGTNMFYGCYGLISFTSELPNLADSSYMFCNCYGLTSFTGKLSTFTDARNMFYGCSALTSFTAGLQDLVNGTSMFRNCAALTSWTIDVPNLTDGSFMFYNCTGLTSWTVELPKLMSAKSMFNHCTGLTSWTAELPNLTDGTGMFTGCILDEASVLCILNSVPTYTDGTHELHLGKRTNYLNSTEIAALLNTTTPIAAATSYKYKGWTITVQS